MNAQELKNFLADSPPSVVRLEIKKHFEALSDKEKRYAHYISQYVLTLQPYELVELRMEALVVSLL
jgi:dipeptidyl-peptidase-3